MTDNQNRIDEIPAEVINFLINFKLTDIVDLDPVPALSDEDTLVLVTDTNVTMRATVEQFMQYLNENLKNFRMWTPVVTNSTLTWKISSTDAPPDPLKFEDILFPMASEDKNGMMSSELFNKLRSIDSDNIIYTDKLNEELGKKAETLHTHDQYQLINNMPKNLSDFNNDEEYITANDIPQNLTNYNNDAGFVTYDDIPIATLEKAGFLSPDILELIHGINDTYVDQIQLSDTIKNLSDSLPNDISAFNNDLGYVKESNLIGTIGEIGSINIIKNSEFRFTDNDGTLQDWYITDGELIAYRDDPDYPYCAKADFGVGGILKGKLAYSLGAYHTITFYAKASEAKTFVVTLGDGVETINVGEFWSKFTITIENKGTIPEAALKFSLEGTETATLYLTRVKVERGRFITEYFPSFDDFDKMLNRRATISDYGIVKPDNYAIGFDEYGRLTILNNPEVVGVQIDDENTSEWTTYSSLKTEERLMTKAPLVDGIIPAEYIPGFYDDILYGEMTIVDDEMVFVIDEDQYTSGDPVRGKLYVDNVTALGYMWTGKTYLPITTDRLGGEVLVKYDKTEKSMYFVFPDS